MLSPGEDTSIEITRATAQTYYCMLADVSMVSYDIDTLGAGNYIGTYGWGGAVSVAASDAFSDFGPFWTNRVSFEVNAGNDGQDLGWIPMTEIVE